jgi:NADPH-dependent ferric siderophore reductase
MANTFGGLPDNAALAERLGVLVWQFAVVAVDTLTPSMRRVTLTADGLDTIEFNAGQDLMFTLPFDATSSVRRRYTIRAVDRAHSTIAVDIATHSGGPGARWITAARPGDRVDAVGPRGQVFVQPAADAHLFVGDDSFLPAAFAMAESLPSDAVARLVLEVDGPDDEQQLTTAATTTVDWIHRAGHAAGDTELLPAAVRALPELTPAAHAYLGGELRAINAARAVLLECGFTTDRISSKPYWRSGRANAPHGEPERDE